MTPRIPRDGQARAWSGQGLPIPEVRLVVAVSRTDALELAGARLGDLPSVASLGVGMRAQWLRHEIVANNLANVSTPGFKQDDIDIVPNVAPPAGYDPGLALDPASDAPRIVPWTDFSPGALRDTGRSLDVALSGPGFFEVETPSGPRYTRGGGFALDAQGVLTTAGGLPVLGQRGRIVLTSDRVQISERGEVRASGQVVDAIRVVDFPQPYRLVKEGHGLFAPFEGVTARDATGYRAVQGALEESNVNAVGAMVRMIDILRTYEAHQRAIQAVDEIDRQAVNEIGRLT
jgi:flagellar basal-body rod protein FlgG